MSQASVRLLGRHLTVENHQAVLAKAKGRTITVLLAQVEKRKLGLTAKPRSRSPIRPGADTCDIRTPPPPREACPARSGARRG
jgi:hypothetical protein